MDGGSTPPTSTCGALAQLVERCFCMAKVAGSIPAGSTQGFRDGIGLSKRFEGLVLSRGPGISKGVVQLAEHGTLTPVVVGSSPASLTTP